MRKKIASMMLACLMVICLLPLQAGAAESVEKVTRYEDGSYTVTTVERYAATRASGTISGRNIKNHYSSDNVLQWRAVLDASFSYNGSSATCTAVNSFNVTIYNSDWSVGSKSTSRSGNTAYGYLTMNRKIVGGTQGVPVTVTLSCDKNGNLS